MHGSASGTPEATKLGHNLCEPFPIAQLRLLIINSTSAPARVQSATGNQFTVIPNR